LSKDIKKTRGVFNSYVGVTMEGETELEETTYYNIYNKDYGTEPEQMKSYFLIRYNDSSPFYPISDRIVWQENQPDVVVYRGDCYINTYTHRVM